MRIAYRSRHGIAQVVLPTLLGHPEYGRWSDGEEKDVPDDLYINVKVAGRIAKVKAVDALLLAGPDFRDAETGVNPDYACVSCGRESLSESFLARDGKSRIKYANEAGERLCERDFLLRQPAESWPWEYHRAVEHSTGFDEATASLAATKALDSAPPASSADVAAAQVLDVLPAPVAESASEDDQQFGHAVEG